jgi:hypothetical protein
MRDTSDAVPALAPDDWSKVPETEPFHRWIVQMPEPNRKVHAGCGAPKKNSQVPRPPPHPARPPGRCCT